MRAPGTQLNGSDKNAAAVRSRVVEITKSDAYTSYEQFPSDATRYGIKISIENVNLNVVDRTSDRHDLLVFSWASGDDLTRRIVSAFAGAIAVRYWRARPQRQPPPAQFGRNCLSARQKPPQRTHWLFILSSVSVEISADKRWHEFKNSNFFGLHQRE